MADINIKQLLKEARQLITTETNIPQGIKLVKKILKKDPNNFWALIYYGLAAQKTNHYSEALEIFSRASKVDSDAVESWKGIIFCSTSSNLTSNNPSFLLAYSHLLRLEHDVDKWKELFEKVKVLFPNDLIDAVSLCIDENLFSSSFKHKIACREISLKSLERKINHEKTILAFEGYSVTLDFYDRPVFCHKAALHLIEGKYYQELSDFLLFTLNYFGVKVYPSRVFLADTLVRIASNDMNLVEKITPLLSESLKEYHSNSPIPVAMSIIYFFENNFLDARDTLETRIYAGDCFSNLLLVKMLMKLADFDGVLFLVNRLGKTFFSHVKDNALKLDLIRCLIIALSCSNDVSYLKYARKLYLKCLKMFGFNDSLFFSQCYACAGLNSKKFFYYLKKIKLGQNMELEDLFLISLYNKRLSREAVNCYEESIVLGMLSIVKDLIHGNVTSVVRKCFVMAEKYSWISEPFVTLGMYYQSIEKFPKALSCYSFAHSKRPHNEDCLWQLVNLLLVVGQEEKALHVLESCRDGLFNKWHLTAEKSNLSAAKIRSTRCEYSRALKNLRHALQLNANSKEILKMIADTYVDLKMLGCAENYYTRLIEEDSEYFSTLIALTYTTKLNCNFTEFYRNSIRCINYLSTGRNNLVDLELMSFAVFCDILQYNFGSFYKLGDDNWETYMRKLLLRVLKRLCDTCYEGIPSNRDNQLVEYPVAIYYFIESHFYAAVKFLHRKNIRVASDMLQFCVCGTAKLIEIYGSDHPSFWKLLGDVLVKASEITNHPLHLPSWLIKDNSTDEFVTCSINKKLKLALKCYSLGLDCANSNRSHEFYYDISIALIKLANSNETVSTMLKFCFLKSALKSISESFINYCPLSEWAAGNVWIHFNIMGATAAMMGSSIDCFSGPFKNFSLPVTEEIRIVNRGVYLLKVEQFKEAQNTFSHARFLPDNYYANSWVGHLMATYLSGNCSEDLIKKLIFHLKCHSNHSLLTWVLSLVFIKNSDNQELVGEIAMIRNIFLSALNQELSVSRLTVLGYCLEIVGELQAARTAFLWALQKSKYCFSEAFEILISNAARLGGRCNFIYDLLGTFENDPFSLSLLNIKHITWENFDRNCFINYLCFLKGALAKFQSEGYIRPSALLGIFVLSSVKPSLSVLDRAMLISLMSENKSVLCKYSEHKLKQFITFLPDFMLVNVLTILENSIFSYCLKNTSLPFVSIYIKKNESCQKRIDSVSSWGKVNQKLSFISKKTEPLSQTNVAIQEQACVEWSENSKLLETVFPPIISSQDLQMLRRQKVIIALENEKKEENKETSSHSAGLLSCPSMAVFSCPQTKINMVSDETVTEHHGCHYLQKNLVVLLYCSLEKGHLSIALKYCNLCLDIRCLKCVNLKEIIPIVAFIGVQMKSIKLLTKAIHLYPNEIVLYRSLLLVNQK